MEFNYDPSVSALSVILMFVTMGIMIAIEKTLGLAPFHKEKVMSFVKLTDVNMIYDNKHHILKI